MAVLHNDIQLHIVVLTAVDGVGRVEEGYDLTHKCQMILHRPLLSPVATRELGEPDFVTITLVKLLQVWTIKVKEYSTQNIYELPVVERYATR